MQTNSNETLPTVDETTPNSGVSPEMPTTTATVETPDIPDESAIREMYSFYTQFQREQQLKDLKEEWGDNFDTTYKEVESYIRSLPEHYQAPLNNKVGASLVAKALAYEKLLNQPQGLDTSTTTPAPAGGYKYTRSQIRKMSEAEYRKEAKAIQDAYTKGLVDTNN